MEETNDRLAQYRAWFKADKEHTAKFREAAKEDYKFLAGEQWEEEDVRKLKSQLRPVITFNRTNPVIQSVSGMEISNRKEVKYYPREAGDAHPNEVLTEGAKWFRDVADADDEDSDAFLDALVCGLGGTETTLNYEEEEAGEPMMAAVNPLELLWDKASRKKNFNDSRRRWRVRKIPRAQAEEMFPDVQPGDLDAKWASLDTGSKPEETQEEAKRYEGDSEAKGLEEQDVTIVHLQYKKRVKVRVLSDLQTGERVELLEGEVKKLLTRAEAMGRSFMEVSSRQETRIQNVFIGRTVIKEGEALCKKHFSFQFVTGYIDRNTGLPYGLMRLMKDPQRWANKWMSQALHILNTQLNGAPIVEKDAFEDVREFEKNWTNPQKVKWVPAGTISGSKIMLPPAQPMPVGFFQMLEFAISSVRDVTGISVEMLGMREANQAASLEYQRRQAGMTILAPLFDNLKRYRRDHGKVMLYIIQNYLADGRLVRVVGKEGAQYVPLALQADAKYDIIVDDQLNSPDQKLMIWQSLMPILPSLPPQIQLALVDYAPLPQSVIDKIKEAAKNLGPSPEQQQAAMLQLQQLMANIKKTESETAENYAQAQQKQPDNSVDAFKAQGDLALTAQRDQKHADLDMTKLAVNTQMQKQGMEQKALINLIKATMANETQRQANKMRNAA